MKRTYRERVTGFGTGEQQRKAALEAAAKFQKLSCREGGQFDKRFHLVTPAAPDGGSAQTKRRSTTLWTRVCQQRAVSGQSRRARIHARKEA